MGFHHPGCLFSQPLEGRTEALRERASCEVWRGTEQGHRDGEASRRNHICLCCLPTTCYRYYGATLQHATPLVQASISVRDVPFALQILQMYTLSSLCSEDSAAKCVPACADSVWSRLVRVAPRWRCRWRKTRGVIAGER